MHDVSLPKIGTAGWTIPNAVKSSFGEGSSHLARYATRFSGVEINSSFYRPHRPATYARWAESTPADFRFAVKVPRSITHELRLVDAQTEFESFLIGPRALGPKLAVLLVQLPPSACFEAKVADRFFREVREQMEAPIACEPRHRTWFEAEADELLKRHRIARVAADPACVAQAACPGGDRNLTYYRLHGSPKIYYSAYDTPYLDRLAAKLGNHETHSRECWCIFDNTALGAATANGLELRATIAGSQRRIHHS